MINKYEVDEKLEEYLYTSSVLTDGSKIGLLVGMIKELSVQVERLGEVANQLCIGDYRLSVNGKYKELDIYNHKLDRELSPVKHAEFESVIEEFFNKKLKENEGKEE